MFPSSVLAKIYVQGSLKNTEKGFEFNLKNGIDSGTLVELGPITVDGKAYEAAALTIVTGSPERGFQERGGDQVTRTAALPVYIGSTFTIRVNGERLVAGEHALNVSVLTREIGRVRFDFKDTVA
jgi:hydroxymethylglutaryl-CoA reductase (NADPH)